MTIITVQVPKRPGDKKHREHFYRIGVDGTDDEAIMLAVKTLLADRPAHEIGLRKKFTVKD